MRPSHFSAAAAAGALVLSGGIAAAQGICNAHFPIRATGPACNGGNAVSHITRPDGIVVCCIAASRPRTNSYNIPSGGDRYAAGLALGMVGLSIVIDLINMFGPSTVSDGASDVAREQDRVRGELQEERRQARREAARWHEAALREVKKGDMRSAEGFLIKAARLAEGAGDYALRDVYERELNVVRATQHMKEGLALQAEGKIFSAEEEMNKAAFYAEKSGRPDLSRRIRDYRQTLAAQRSPSKSLREKHGLPPRITEKSTCLEVNGKMICE